MDDDDRHYHKFENWLAGRWVPAVRGGPTCHVPWVSLYRWRDADGVLLYVGVAMSPGNRADQHAKSAEWWPYATAVSVQWYVHRWRAEDAERKAYTHEYPIFNINGVPWPEYLRRRRWYHTRLREIQLRRKETVA